MKTLLVAFAGQRQISAAPAASPGPGTSIYGSLYAKDSVYICYSSTSYAYHSSPNCRGLNRCTHEIIKVSLEDAKNKYNHRPCKICE